jgi:hypothetical protein
MATETIIRETDFHDSNLVDTIRRLMMERRTGELRIHMSQGRVCSLMLREKISNGNGNGNGAEKNFVDSESEVAANSPALAQTGT